MVPDVFGSAKLTLFAGIPVLKMAPKNNITIEKLVILVRGYSTILIALRLYSFGTWDNSWVTRRFRTNTRAYPKRAFSMDERIAWGLIPIKEEVFGGETLDDWYSLSGKQGDEKEGMINLVLAYRKVPAPPPAAMVYPNMPVMMVPQPVVPGAQVVYPGSYGPCQPVPIAQPPPQLQRTPNQHDIEGLKDMFPNMEESVIRSVLEASGGDVNAATTHLLSMTSS